MQHLSTETYNNEQVSKVLFRISAETCLKWIILLVNSLNLQPLEDPPLDPYLDLMTRECAKNLLPLNIFG